MSTKKAKIRWTWIDDKAAEYAAMPSVELNSLQNIFENQRVPSDRTMECAILLRAELTRREEAAAAALGI